MTSTVRRIGIWALIVALSVISLAGIAQGFGPPSSSFGQEETDRTFGTSQASAMNENAGERYFLHDQLAKLLLIVGFSIAGILVVVTRRFALRKWLLLASVIVLGFVVGGLLCPVSAVQNVILKASTAYLLMFLVPTVLALFAGRLFCGYVCPFGALQEWLHVRRWRVTIPERWMRILRFVPYVVLIYLVARTVATGVLTWNDSTPFKAFFTWGGTPATWAVSGVFAALSLIVFRPFCALFCPLGAWLALVSRLSPLRVREEGDCVTCSQCNQVCPTGAITCGTARSDACLLCGECIRRCPVRTLGFGRRAKR